jgi:alpha-mannosidase
VELWGVGNHGGGPSRVDLARINTLAAGRKDIAIVHSTPQAYFRELARIRQKLPRHTADLNPWAVGCYISQVRVKQRHRRLENELYACEKMASAAAFQGLMEYPAAELRAALEDLLLAEFHDVLPGSSIQPAEEAALRMMDHGLEIASRVKARAFFAMARGQKAAAKDTLPILVYNPHPHRVRAIVECELQPSDINFQRTTWRAPQILRNGRRLPCQCEKEASNVPLDWRKRVVFLADLEPGRMNRFDCRMEMQPAKPAAAPRIAGGSFRFKTRDLDVTVNARTGLLDRYRARGADLLRPGAFRPIVMEDSEDSWAMTVRGFRKVAGRFALASAADGAAWSGLRAPLPSVRIVEDGEVRTVVETVFRHGHSFICQRYKLPKAGTEVEVETRVHWAEKDRLLKLSLPTTLAGGEFLGQVACGVQRLPDNGDEAVAQKWVGVIGRRRGLALTVANDGTYAADFAGGELRLSLLRSAAYSAHPWSDWAAPGKILRRDRFTPRMEQGERVFRFWLNGGRLAGRMENVDREALVHNEKPMALSFFPPGDGPAPKPFVEIRGAAVQLMAAKRAERGRDLVLRLFEPTGRSRRVTLRLPFAGLRTGVALGPFEIRTLRINPRKRAIREVSLAETEKPRRSRQPAQ